MNFGEYQKKSRKTAIYPKIGYPVIYPAMGLAGETGEVLERIKKLYRDDNGKLSDEKKQSLAMELGDVLWYLSQIATELDIKMEDVATGNLKKLNLRLKNNTLFGKFASERDE